ncbi:hypothetical protein CGC49_10265 [Capnocytophaga sp. H4358]|uniref:O-antigen ligase family protein n=1 Tax=Capnocytophaga sp. H4358 TaxID=1945658 RepID=UPI000BB173B5|nr:O-antigen ligase family protein [Capnocytophaga sp. H4358]ATA73624.1 hypothetical protein CGC49_10265 [Capnocytophaga sp. H4358]
MNFLTQKNSYFAGIIAFLILTLILPLIKENFWNEEHTKDWFFRISAGYFFLMTTFWSYFNKSLLFSKSLIRNLMLIVAASISILWTYKMKITYRFDIILVFLGILHSVLYRKFIKPNAIIIGFSFFTLWRIIGLLWSPDIAYALQITGWEMTTLMILTCIFGLNFRATPKETNAFIAISFKLLLGLLAVNIAIYHLYINTLEKSFFSFFTLNKGYLPYYEVLRWSVFKHPSFITWLLLLIGGLGFLVHKENKKLISIYEVVLYAILLLFLMLIVQARVTILSYVLSLLFFFWLHISKNWSFKNKAIIIISAVALGISSITFLVQNTIYFSDPIRANMYEKGFEKIKENPILGNGTSTQSVLLKDIGHPHLHNDFLASCVDLGIIGLLLLIGWIISIFYIGTRDKNTKIIYTICIFLPMMNTETILFSDFGAIGGTILIPFLIYLFFVEEKSIEELP